MTFRTVVVETQCKLSYKNNYLVVRTDSVNLLHLSEIDSIIVDSTMVSITSYLLCELIKRKIALIFCDEKHHPHSELFPIYGCHNTSKKIIIQVNWKEQNKLEIWTAIVKKKIIRQAQLLKYFEMVEYQQLFDFAEQIELGDKTNREGHAAKVYFHALFGFKFSRDLIIPINATLDYGYSIVLALINREIVANGYLTQLGIGHKNEFNYYNLSCDLMEPLRQIVDLYVFKNISENFGKQEKLGVLKILSKQVQYDQKNYCFNNAVSMYVKNTLDCINNGNSEELKFLSWL